MLLEDRISEQSLFHCSAREAAGMCCPCVTGTHKATHGHKHARQRTHSCIFKRVCKHTQLKMDCSVTVVTIQAVITATGRTFN